MGRLSGKNVLVTGASSGIGEAIAIRFAREGARVAINYNSGKERAEGVKAATDKAGKTGGVAKDAITVQADVSNEDQVKKMFGTVLKEFGRLDILVNNSGVQKAAPSHELEMSDFDRVIGTNLRGSFLCSREALKHFLSRSGGGVIVNNSSVHEIIPKPNTRPTQSAKAAWKI